MKQNELLAWIDIETTGLDPLEDSLLEVACIVTDQDLNELGRESWTVFYMRPEEKVYDPIVSKMHYESGLWFDCEFHGMLELDFVMGMEKFLENILASNPDYARFVMAGSGVARFDYTWFQFNFQRLLERFSYYTLDIGVVRRALELAGYFSIRADDAREGHPEMVHRAMTDIEDHLEEWRYYRGILKLEGDTRQWEDWVPNAWRTNS